MARIRYLKPEFFLDEDIGYLTVTERLAYSGLWCHADREGRLDDRPRLLKAQIFPYDDVDMEPILAALASPKQTNPTEPFILRYEVKGQKYIQILKFLEHQKPHHTERKSSIPPPPNRELTVNTPLIDGGYPVGKGSKRSSMGKKIYGEEKEEGKLKGSEKEKKTAPVDNFPPPATTGADNGGNAEGHPPVAPALTVDPEIIKLGEVIKRRQAEGIPH
jgi:hypothetical protein